MFRVEYRKMEGGKLEKNIQRVERGGSTSENGEGDSKGRRRD